MHCKLPTCFSSNSKRCIGSPRQGIFYTYHGHLNVVTDAEMDKRSIIDYCSLAGGNMYPRKVRSNLAWAHYSSQTEYHAMAHGECELYWLRNLI